MEMSPTLRRDLSCASWSYSLLAPWWRWPPQITVFKSLGVVAQDLFAAWVVAQLAQQADAGVTVPF
jgi:ornithine cyclodeaminase/alanine dehydrogenase-like protein (mu-crystallin family)